MTKKRSKENFLLKERSKIESEVFDRMTLTVLSKMMKKGIIDTVEYPISTGKEANVFMAKTPEGSIIAIKIYKVTTSAFFRKDAYIVADPRFKKIKHDEKGLVNEFANKEMKNLKACEAAGVHCPKPLYHDKNVIVMQFLGEGELPYPTLIQIGNATEEQLESILEDMKKMYRAGIVHGDVSEYNILIGPVPYIIDFGQGVSVKHPKAMEFLERDVFNVLHYFAKFGFERDVEKVMKWIRQM